MFRRLLSSVFVMGALMFLAKADGEEFQKFSFIDPYSYLMGLYYDGVIDTTGLAPDSYFAQMDSLGITMALTRCDYQATSNPYGIKVVGQLNMKKFSGHELNYLVHISHIALGQVEKGSAYSIEGAYWLQTGGDTYFPQGDTSAGLIYIPGIDPSGEILVSQGPKFGCKYTRYIYPRIRMAVWDTLSTDTVLNIVFFHVVDSLADSCKPVPPNTVPECDVRLKYWTTTNLYYTGVDFRGTPPGQWKTFQPIPPFFSREHSIGIHVFWSGSDSVAIDEISLFDSYGKTLRAITDAQIDSAFMMYYNSINTDNHGRFYPTDEPGPPQFWGCNFFDDGAARNYPYHRSMASMNWSIPLYIHDVEPLEVMPNNYPITVSHDSATSGETLPSIQNAYSTFLNVLRQRHDSTAMSGTDFWMLLQGGGYEDTINPSSARRNPTALEIRVLQNLSLLYDVSGLGYFTYSELYSEGTFPWDTDPASETYSPDTLIMEMGNLAGKVCAPGGRPEPTFNGMVEWNNQTQRFETTERWHSAKEGHIFIDSIWPALEPLEWQDAGSWLNVRAVTGNLIDSIYSLTFAASQSYIQCARFTSSAGDNYVLMVNRRSLSSDSQNVVIQVNGSGLARFVDIYTGEVHDVYDSSGTIRFVTHFAPAELKFFRVERFSEFAGNLSDIYANDNEFTWPDYSTINITGDITIDTGKRLIVNRNANVNIPYCSDILHSGADTTKTEIIVKGRLDVVGNPSARITLGTAGAGIGWRGIRSINSGQIVLSYSDIKNAYCGVEKTSNIYSTIDNCKFINCGLHAIKSTGDSLVVSYCSVDTTLDQYSIGLSLDGSYQSIVHHCTFDESQRAVKCLNSGVSFSSCAFHVDTSAEDSYGFYIINSRTSISASNIVNFRTAIKGASGNIIVLDQCEIYSEPFDSLETEYGIDRWNCALARDTVRNCCFYGIKEMIVSTLCHTIYMGSSGDYGHNYSYALNPVSNPNYFIYYDDGGILLGKLGTMGKIGDPDPVLAIGNEWDIEGMEDTLETHYIILMMSGNIDYLPQGLPYQECTPDGEPNKQYSSSQATDSFLPIDFVKQNYPNPFNPFTVIEFSISEPGRVELYVTNLLGQKVVTLWDADLPSGKHQFMWNGNNDRGEQVATGVYFYTLEAGTFVETKKMIILK